jgi:hypothetical protein
MFEEEEEIEKKTMRDYLIEYCWLILLVLLAVLMRNRIDPIVINQGKQMAFFIVACGVLAVWCGKSLYITFRNSTPKIVYNYGHSTTDGEIIPAGNFGIMRPAVKAYQWYFKLKGAYVAPLDAINKVGPNIFINAKMEKVELDEMPIEVRSAIRELNIPPPYFLGFADEEQYSKIIDLTPLTEKDPEVIKYIGISRPDVSYLIDELKKVNKQVALREKILSGDVSVIEKFVAGASRIQSRAKGDIWEALKKAVTTEE